MKLFIFPILVLPVILLGGLLACQGDDETSPSAAGPERRTAMIKVTSNAFKEGERIPEKYTGEGEDLSVPLEWQGAPEETREFVLICDDPDAPTAQPWVHWVLYGIPGNVASLPEGSNAGAREGKNGWGRTGYGGPMPPQGHGVHHYHFKIYALKIPLDLREGATKQEVLKAMSGKILAEGELVGTYERK